MRFYSRSRSARSAESLRLQSFPATGLRESAVQCGSTSALHGDFHVQARPDARQSEPGRKQPELSVQVHPDERQPAEPSEHKTRQAGLVDPQAKASRAATAGPTRTYSAGERTTAATSASRAQRAAAIYGCSTGSERTAAIYG